MGVFDKIIGKAPNVFALVICLWLCLLSSKVDAAAFISKWNTDLSGISDDHTLMLPLAEGGIYNFDIDWGDGLYMYIYIYIYIYHIVPSGYCECITTYIFSEYVNI